MVEANLNEEKLDKEAQELRKLTKCVNSAKTKPGSDSETEKGQIINKKINEIKMISKSTKNLTAEASQSNVNQNSKLKVTSNLDYPALQDFMENRKKNLAMRGYFT